MVHFFGNTGDIVRTIVVHDMGKILDYRSNIYAYIYVFNYSADENSDARTIFLPLPNENVHA